MTRLLLATVAALLVVFSASTASACEGGCGGAGGCGQAAGGCGGGCGAAKMARKAPALKPPEGLPADAKQVAIKVDGMRCDGCVTKIEAALAKLEGVIEADVTFAEGARITYMPEKVNVEQLRKAIDDAGFKSDVVM